ncbi:MAG: SIR2 family NAD-dependent protein deacylase [Acidimicrobiales bacterium]
MISQAKAWIAAADSITVLSGAGISTGSGIPDYRGPQGVWTRNPGAERMATIDHYLADPEVRAQAWRSRVTSPIWDAQPNAGHLALVALEPRITVVTQNIDGLHQRAGSRTVIELHGTVWRSRCMSCRDERPMAETLERVRNHEEDPPCRNCGGILKSATISFGENLDPGVVARAQQVAEHADVFLAVGSSLGVHPAAALVPLARRTATRLIIANAEPTPYDGLADALFHEPLSEFLPALVGEC